MLGDMWVPKGFAFDGGTVKAAVCELLTGQRFQRQMGFGSELVNPGDGGTFKAQRALVLHDGLKKGVEKQFNVSMAWAPRPVQNGARQRALILDTNINGSAAFKEFVCACIELVGENNVKLVGILNCIDVQHYEVILQRILRDFTNKLVNDNLCQLECYIGYSDDLVDMQSRVDAWGLQCGGIRLKLRALQRHMPFGQAGSRKGGALLYLGDRGDPSDKNSKACPSHTKILSKKGVQQPAKTVCSLYNVTAWVELIKRQLLRNTQQ